MSKLHQNQPTNGAGQAPCKSRPMADSLDEDAVELMRAFMQIKDREVRNSLVELTLAVAFDRRSGRKGSQA